MRYRLYFIISLVFMVLLASSLMLIINHNNVEAEKQTRIIKDLNSEIETLTIQKNDSTRKLEGLKPKLRIAQTGWRDDKKRLEDLKIELQETHERYIFNIKEIDKVNKDFESYGEMRFQEGHIRVIFWGCMRRTYDVIYCSEFTKSAYDEKVWEYEVPGWEFLWAILRGTKLPEGIGA